MIITSTHIILLFASALGAVFGFALYELIKLLVKGLYYALVEDNSKNARAYMKHRKEEQNRAMQEYLEKNLDAFAQINQRVRDERINRQHKAAHNDCIVERRRRSHDRSRDNSSTNSGTGSGLM